VQITNAGKALHARKQSIRWHPQPGLRNMSRSCSSSLSDVVEHHVALDSSADAAQQAHSRARHSGVCTVHSHMQTVLPSSKVFRLYQPELMCSKFARGITRVSTYLIVQGVVLQLLLINVVPAVLELPPCQRIAGAPASNKSR